MSERQHHVVTLEADIDEPALVPAAFDLLHLNARACGLPDVERIHIHLTVKVEGSCYDAQVKELKSRLHTLWFGGVSKVQIIEPGVPEEANETKEVEA